MCARTIFVLLVGTGILGLSACEEQGPAERAGETIDNAISEAQDRAEDVVDEAEEAVSEIGDAIQNN